MSPTDVRFVAFFSLAVGSLMGYFLLHQKKTDVTSQAPDVMHNQDESNVVGQIQAEKSIRLVVQRFRKASLLIEESRTVTVGDDAAEGYSGILVYASFAKSATEESVIQAAKTIMNLPLLTRGVWGDGSDPVSVLDMATQGSAGVAVMLVPQANLISKVRSQGRSIQYHGQIGKAAGQALYEYLVDCVRAIALEHQCTNRGEPIPKWLSDFGKPDKVDVSVPPNQLFLIPSQYSSWDDNGIPQCNQHGEPLTKSSLKKLKKIYQAQEKRYEKHLKAAASTTAATTSPSANMWSLLDDKFINVVSGTFGKRQGLEISSDMGPFCHVLNL